MITREELKAKKEEELNAWREKRKKELFAEGFPKYIGDSTNMTEDEVTDAKEKFEEIVVYQIEKEESDALDAINEKYRETEELLDEGEAEQKKDGPLYACQAGEPPQNHRQNTYSNIIVMGGNVKIKGKGVKHMKQMEVLKIAKILAKTPELLEFMKIAVILPDKSIRQVIERMETGE